LKDIVKEVCLEKEAELFEIECDKDHVHLLVEVDPQYGIHRLIKQMKALWGRKVSDLVPHRQLRNQKWYTLSMIWGSLPHRQLRKFLTLPIS